jgi:hypothetical protein
MIFQNFFQKPSLGVSSGVPCPVHANSLGHFIALANNAGQPGTHLLRA